jgi:hypothetical protein
MRRSRRSTTLSSRVGAVALAIGCVAACAVDPGAAGPGGPDGDDVDGGLGAPTDDGPGGASDPTACSSLFDEDTLPRFDLVLAPAERAALDAEFRAPLAESRRPGAGPRCPSTTTRCSSSATATRS